MTDTIMLHLDFVDAKQVEVIFNRKDNPGFTIISKYEMHDIGLVNMEICFNTIVDLWWLAKEVEMLNESDERIALHNKKIAALIQNK